jgi:hypothetical protein
MAEGKYGAVIKLRTITAPITINRRNKFLDLTLIVICIT